MLRHLASLACIALAAACAGGDGHTGQPRLTQAPDGPAAAPTSSNDERIPTPPFGISTAEAFRFLNQATMGATEDAAKEVMEVGFDAWIEKQLTVPPSLQLPKLQTLPRPQPLGRLHVDRVDAWYHNALHGEDQLRQRVAFALSEIMVVSEVGALANAQYALASYYDLLALEAFGNFRSLIEQVTLHPAMGVYLSMLGNRKAAPDSNIRPDENYARELMQLFTIGLVELEIDGTPRLNENEVPIPTYDQSVIEGFARVFTGWHYADAATFQDARLTDENQIKPMQLYPEFHDGESKRLLGDVTLPAGQTGERDLRDALDVIFHHPNVGPFISKALIQRLVTSNPSRAYVERVARAFNDNGLGIRGDLAQVVRAILLDPEARSLRSSSSTGKLKEPILRITQFWRAYPARVSGGPHVGGYFYQHIGQGPLQAPSVFNFFNPFYTPPGEIADAGLVAPEFEIATEYNNTVLTNFLFQQTRRHTRTPGLRGGDVVIDIEEEIGLADDPHALVRRIAAKLLGGEISPVLHAEAVRLAKGNAPRAERAADVIYLIATSPEFAAQQ